MSHPGPVRPATDVGIERRRLREERLNARAEQKAFVASLAARLTEDPSNDVALLSAAYPIVLLPVRVETRFARDAGESGELHVRVYPDEIAADTHEPALTDDEYSAGVRYWTTAWDATQEGGAWTALLREPFPAPRAAWIVRTTTPVNLAQRPIGAPQFPDVAFSAAPWTHPAVSRVLPDRWLVRCYRQGQVAHEAIGLPIADPLPLTISPVADPSDPTEVIDLSGDGLRVDRDVLWTFDFEAAVAAGMAVRIPLAGRDFQFGFDRVLVLGVKGGLTPAQGSARLAAMLDGHHYTRGLAIVPQGTPTNNTSSQVSGVPVADPDGSLSFVVERGSARATSGTVGRQLADALGMSHTVLDHVSGAERRDQEWARAMNDVLWPTTWGYYLSQILDPLLDAATIDAVRWHFRMHVRGRGPLPTFRVGNVPYGALPVSSLANWGVRGELTGVRGGLPNVLRELHSKWSTRSRNVARVGRSSDRDQDIVDVLAMDASAREVWIRTAIGPDAGDGFRGLPNIQQSELERIWRETVATNLLEGLGRALGRPVPPDRVPRGLYATFSDDAHRFAYPFVSERPLSEDAPLDFNYLRWIGREASLAQLVLERGLPGHHKPTPLLYRMVRHALLTLYGTAATDIHVRTGLMLEAERREPELVGIVPGTENRTTVVDRMRAHIDAISEAMPVGEFVRQTATAVRLAEETGRTLPDLATMVARAPESLDIAAYLSALAIVEPLPTAELERLCGETLDTASHRLDAWITSLYSERLGEMRAAQPLGAHIGGYAWLEDLRPAPAARTRELQGIGTVTLQPGNGGYIHAPSMNHAAAAAVLRNAQLTRSVSQDGRYAIDVSSNRARTARLVLDGVRQGQSLRALTGYLFERAVHETHLDRFIEVFRIAFPLPERNEPDLAADAERLSARDVVDGEALRAAFRAGSIQFVSGGVTIGGGPSHPATAAEQSAIRGALQTLDDALDAVADVLVADSVYELVRGSTTAAAADLDALGRGIRAPDPEVTRVPRGGTTLTHRVAVVLGDGPVAAPAWEAIADTPRSSAEPRLDRWVGQLLGDPSTVRCRVDLPDPTTDAPDRRREVVVSLAQLALRPLDVLALARVSAAIAPSGAVGAPIAGPATGGTELDRRFVDAAIASTQLDVQLGTARVIYERAAGWSPDDVRTVPEIVEIARAINELLGNARALRPADLQRSTAGASGRGSPADPAAENRANAAVIALAAAHSELESVLTVDVPDAGDLRTALRIASLFGTASYPPPPVPNGADALYPLALAASTDLAARFARAGAATDASARAAAVFGRDFLLLPEFVPEPSMELASALAYGPTLGASEDARARWLQQAARVRPPLARWRALALYSAALGTPLRTFDVAQLPHVQPARWAALPFVPDERPPSGRVSLDLVRIATPAADAPWAGVMLDEWSETIPAASESTAVAAHYDDPGAEAPQAVLIAVLSTNAERWSLPMLEATLNETLDLAKIRAVDFEVLGEYGQVLPAVYLAANAAGDTVSTDFSGARVVPGGIVEG